MTVHSEIWNTFCERVEVRHKCVPLFQHSDDLVVSTKTIGHKVKRSVLCRSPQMDELIIRETDKLVEDWESKKDIYDGLIYMMFLISEGRIVPLYIGKAETIGIGNRNLSANINGLKRDKSKFARWGDNYAYHIGDLSAVVLPNHQPNKVNKKYVDWAKTLFEEFPSPNPMLKQKVYFWTTAWSKSTIGMWEQFGTTRLTFQEYLMIGVASSCYPDVLLNREGQNRG